MNDELAIRHFQDTVREYYRHHGRHELPWRQSVPGGGFSPYRIMVSEVMLQQTQVARVVPKYELFLERFPDARALASADQGEALRAWSGLGYNRRAKYLWQAARQVVDGYGDGFPVSLSGLEALPGIGKNTAGAILAYAYEQPAVFIETNIRTVVIHHFFNDHSEVADRNILELIERTLDRENPREWYWALMDYGSFLKQTVGNLNRRSKSYAKQSTFEGSRRQLRGQIIRLLAERPLTIEELKRHVPDERLAGVVTELLDERMIRRQGEELVL